MDLGSHTSISDALCSKVFQQKILLQIGIHNWSVKDAAVFTHFALYILLTLFFY